MILLKLNLKVLVVWCALRRSARLTVVRRACVCVTRCRKRKALCPCGHHSAKLTKPKVVMFCGEDPTLPFTETPDHTRTPVAARLSALTHAQSGLCLELGKHPIDLIT